MYRRLIGCCVLWIVVSHWFRLSAQNIYDYQHSRQFASHLLKSGQFDQAVTELERLLFLTPPNDTLQWQLITAYRMGGNRDQGLERARQLYPQLSAMPARIAYEYGKILLEKQEYEQAGTFWQGSTAIDTTDKQLLTSTSFALKGDFHSALRVVEPLAPEVHPLVVPYQSLMAEAARLRTRSPALAGMLSAVVPGTGRFYARDWKDGVFSLLFMSTTAWQSYRGFRKSGVESPRGWIYGGVAMGFYLGNIYGSVKAAQKYNQRRKEHYQKSAGQLFHSYY